MDIQTSQAQVQEIDAIASGIIDSADQTVRLIAEKRAAMDAQGKQDDTLYVFLGEHHLKPAHVLHHLAVLNGLQADEKDLLVAYETAHNKLYDYYSKVAGDYIGADAMFEKILAPMDENGELSLLSDIAFSEFKDCNHTNKMFMAALRQSGLSTFFSDVPTLSLDDEDYLDPSDSLTQMTLKAFDPVLRNSDYGDNIRPPILATSMLGVILRNHMMLEALSLKAGDKKPRIVVQICGNAHVGGYATQGIDFDNSLVDLCAYNNIDFLAFPAVTQQYGRDDIDCDDPSINEHIHCIEGLPSLSASYESAQDKAELDTPELESAFTQAIMLSPAWKERGLDDFAIDHEQMDDFATQAQIYLSQLFWATLRGHKLFDPSRDTLILPEHLHPAQSHRLEK